MRQIGRRMSTTNARAGIVGKLAIICKEVAGRLHGEKHLDSMVMVARGASRNVRIVRMYPLTVLFTFTMVIIINSKLGLTILYLDLIRLPP